MKVTVGEEGKVIAVRALCGHPDLVRAVEPAARGTRYIPTLVAGKPVKVSGIDRYNFNLHK